MMSVLNQLIMNKTLSIIISFIIGLVLGYVGAIYFVLEITSYSDEYLSFEYPSNVQPLRTDALEGRFLRILELLTWDNDSNTYVSSGVRLMYPHVLEDDETFENLRQRYSEISGNVVSHTEINVDERLSVDVLAGGLCGDYRDIYIPIVDEAEKFRDLDVVYLLQYNACAFKDDLGKEIIDIIVSSADLKR